MLKGISCSFPHGFSVVGSSRGSKKLRAFFLVLLSCSCVYLRSLGDQYCRAGGSLLESKSCTLGAHSHLFPSLAQFHHPLAKGSTTLYNWQQILHLLLNILFLFSIPSRAVSLDSLCCSVQGHCQCSPGSHWLCPICFGHF